MKTTYYIPIAAAAILTIASCEKTDTVETNKPNIAPSPALRAVLDAPVTEEAQAIHTIRETAQVGDTVTVKGWIMGHLTPFVEGRAAFILGDPEVITACNMRPGDGCDTPWDACCDTPEDKQRGTASIQILGEDGRILKEGLEDVGGLKNLSKLLITGTIAEGSSAENLMINATAIDFQPES